MEKNNIEFSQLEEAIVKTVAFFDMFNYPLTAWEIWKYLGQSGRINEVEAGLTELKAAGLLDARGGFYFIQGRGDLPDIRQKQYVLSEEKYQIARRVAKILRFLPGIKLVGICNNFYYRPESDIDLFIITKQNRLWFSRLMVTLLVHAFGLRRHGDRVADRACLSFYVSEDNLDLEPIANPQDPYLIHWAVQLIPIYDQADCYQGFWRANAWVRRHLPNAYECQPSPRLQVQDTRLSRLTKQAGDFFFQGVWGRLAEKTAKKIQLKHMLKNAASVATADDTRVVISDCMLKFHEEDRRQLYRAEHERRVKEVLAKSRTEAASVKQPPAPVEFGAALGKDLISRLFEYAFYLFVFLLPWQSRLVIRPGELNGAYSEYGTISLLRRDLVLGLVLVLAAVQLWRQPEKPRQNWIKQPAWILAGLELSVFISIWLATDRPLAFYRYLVFLGGLGLYWLASNMEFKRISLFYTFLAGALVQAWLGTWQFLSQASFANKWLGLAAHPAGEGGTSVIEVLNGGRWLRAYGSLDHPNILGGFLCVIFLLLVLSVLSGRRMIRSGWFVFLNYVAVPSLAAGILFSFSRSAWLACLIGLAGILLTAVLKRNLFAQKKTLRIVLLAGITAYLLFIPYRDLVFTGFDPNARLEAKSLNERQSSLQEAKAVIAERPLLGVGIGNFTQAAYGLDPGKAGYTYQPTHNTFLLAGAEVGALGLTFLILFFAWLVVDIWHRKSYKFEIYKLALIASLLIMMMLDHWWWSLHFGVYFFWLTLGLATVNNE